ncbi:hypothetical protein [Microbulbifer sp. YPW1]|uniref:hypothetical protein n=1 Tax=Microbulbifer sp. YPW1 TaxID=2745199 RepID=UPI001C6315F1|nr:hypothetical protein [Microbulbifer sp. YPW1]
MTAQATTQDQADIIICHATIVDVEHRQLLPDQAVATRRNRIDAVGHDADVAKRWHAEQTVNGRNRYLIPGLWDMHVHFGGGEALTEENLALLPLCVANGVTTIRDASGGLPPGRAALAP